MITIVNYEKGINNGILTKYATKLYEGLLALGEQVEITQQPNPKSKVNYHINYLPYKHENSPKSINALMITHIFDGYKLDAVKKGMETADIGICMSNETLEQMVEAGIPRDKLTIVLPAHDGHTRRHQIVAILTNVYPDGCKREHMFTELVKHINYNEWAFRIMGSGWHEILAPLVADGLQVDYFSDFQYDLHKQILESSDYSLYFGKDEGSMGILDSANAGLKTIAPNVGFHKEIGIDYPFDTQDELNLIFMSLNKNKVRNWTWDRYTRESLKAFNLCKKTS
jgi:hypothetical protein